MKIYFNDVSHIHKHNFSNPEFNHYVAWFHFDYDYDPIKIHSFKEGEIDVLIDKLTEKFPSIKIDKRIRHVNNNLYSLYCSFYDNADEAFFLLLTSNGFDV